MGEYADMFIDGTLDAETGELLDGASAGYPRVRRGKRIVGQFDAGPKPFQCSACKKKFRVEQGLRDHIRDKHP